MRGGERHDGARGWGEGLAGELRRLDAGWHGWSGRVAHPDSPLGSGGPGHFRSASPVGAADPGAARGAREAAAEARTDAAIELEAPAGVPRPANLPPATQARSLGTLKSVQTDHVDVDIEGEVQADGRGGPARGAHTRVDVPRATAPGYAAADGKVTRFRGKFTWKGVITIQTQYGSGATARSVSCYGRGTTPADVRNRDITLGFHESCHQRDYAAYLSGHPLPAPPALSVGMTPASYDAEVQRFFDALRDYVAAMTSHSEARTDEVGHRRSDVAARGCFAHHVP